MRTAIFWDPHTSVNNKNKIEFHLHILGKWLAKQASHHRRLRISYRLIAWVNQCFYLYTHRRCLAAICCFRFFYLQWNKFRFWGARTNSLQRSEKCFWLSMTEIIVGNRHHVAPWVFVDINVFLQGRDRRNKQGSVYSTGTRTVIFDIPVRNSYSNHRKLEYWKWQSML